MKNLYVLLVLFCFLLSCKNANDDTAMNAACQNLEEALKNTKDTAFLRQTLEKAYLIADKYAFRRHDSLIAVGSKAMGDAVSKSEVRYYCQKGLNYGLRALPVTAEIIAQLYRNTGLSYYNSDDYATALRYFDSVKITSTEKRLLVIKTKNVISIAQCYQYLKDYGASERFFQEAMTLAKICMTEKESVVLYMRYASCLRVQKKYTESVNMATKIVTILDPLSKNKDFVRADSFYLASGYFYIAYAYEDSGKYDLAAKYFNCALPLYKKMNDVSNQVSLYVNLGLTYRYNKQYDEAEKVLTEAIALINQEQKLSEFLHHKKGSLFVNRSEVYLAKQAYTKAITDHDSAIFYLTQYDKNPNLTALLMNNRHSLLSVYADKAKALIALAEKGEKGENTEGGYQKALTLFEKIIDLSDDIRADYVSDDAKLTLAENIKPAYEKALQLCFQLYQKAGDSLYLHRAFAFAEHSRSMILYENTRLNNQLPTDLQAENADLKKREAELVQKNNTDDLQTYLRLKRAFREKIKAYNRSQIVAVSTIQHTLLPDNKTALIEYFVGDNTFFVLTLTRDSLKMQQLPKTADFDKNLLTLRTAIVAENNAVFNALSSQLYHQILPDWLQNRTAPETINRLIIIPDGVLNYLPFETLRPPQYLGISDVKKGYLIENYTISYAPSAQFLMEQTHRPPPKKGLKTLLAFAPQYKSQDTLSDVVALQSTLRSTLSREGAYALPQAVEEVENIQKVVGGTAFLNADADEKTFKNQAEKAKILHLAMHALTDDNNPALSRLLFTKNPKDTLNDNDLTVAELNTMTLNADLAVLSACNTGFGKLNKGEGVMSLARAFHYAGVPSTVMSLWQVPDVGTDGIMLDFYKNLKAGQPKDEALRQAKLNYLAHVKLADKAAPFYWSAFVLSGSTAPLDFETPLSIFSYLAIFLGLLVALFVFLKYRKSLK